MRALLLILTLMATFSIVSASEQDSVFYRFILGYYIGPTLFSTKVDEGFFSEDEFLTFSEATLTGGFSAFQNYYELLGGSQLWLDSNSINENIWLEMTSCDLDLSSGWPNVGLTDIIFFSMSFAATNDPDSAYSYNYSLNAGRGLNMRFEKDEDFNNMISQLGIAPAYLKFYYNTDTGLADEGITTENMPDYISFKAERFGEIVGLQSDEPTSVENCGLDLEEKNYILHQNYPNPFNPETKIVYNLPRDGYVKLRVYNVMGELVETLVDGFERKGSHEVIFSGGNLASGLYFYELEAESFRMMKKMILLK